jgi:nucleoside-diphosphate-sugar epimerase
MRVLLTGATGFVGSHLVDRLLERGHQVTALVRSPTRAAPLAARGVTLIAGDLADAKALARATEGQELVHHVAGLTGAVDEAEFLATNRDGTARLLDAATEAGVRRFVLVSSGAAAGPTRRGRPATGAVTPAPVTMYGRSKLAAERVVTGGELPWTVLRPPAVYGPRDTENFLAVYRTIKRLGIAPVFGDGSQELSMIHVADLAEACALAGEAATTASGIYYVNHPEVVTSRQVIEAIGRSIGRQPTIVPLPELVTRGLLALTGGWAALLRRKTILRPDKANEFYQEAWTGDPSSFIAHTGWAPRFDLARGTADTAGWYRQEGLL